MEDYEYNLKCKICGKNHLLTVSIFDVDRDDDRQMGPEVYYQGEESVTCDCGNEISITVDASEYPIGAPIEIYNVSLKGCKFTESE